MENGERQDNRCSFCKFKCNCQSQPEEHMSKHNPDRSFVCDKCGRGFSFKGNLKRHKLCVHQEELTGKVYKKYKCSLCSYASHQKSNLNAHILTHTKEQSFPCQQANCRYTARLSSLLRLHNIHKHQNVRKFLCQVLNCGYRGQTTGNLRMHSMTHSDLRPFVCDFDGCKYRAKLKGALRVHQRDVHSGGHKPFACSICNYRTTSNVILRNHALTHAKEKSVKCVFSGCSFACKSKMSLKAHVICNHSERTIKCDFDGCSRTFASRSLLEVHKKSVHYEKTYKCPICSHRTAASFAMRMHMEGHNRRIPCPTKGCTFQARNSQSLKRHVRHHEENLVCPVDGCGFVRSASASWNLHMKVHDSCGRPFHCPLCSKHFFTQGCLNSHLKIHTREKPFKCPVCDYACAKKYRMIQHVRIVHSTVFPDSVLDKKAACNHYCGVNFGHATGLAMHTMKLKTAVVVLTRLEVETKT